MLKRHTLPVKKSECAIKRGRRIKVKTDDGDEDEAQSGKAA